MVSARERRLRDIFNYKYLFSIPSYQRPYAWTTEETSELLDDLLYAMREREEGNDALSYFLGSIVIIKEGSDQPKAEVVDGQQRLTTLTILLCVLRELSDGDMESDLDAFVRQRESRLTGTESFSRLTLRERDKDFFEEKVLMPGRLQDFLEELSVRRTDSQQRIFENSQYLWQKLSKLNREDRDKLAQFVSQHCQLVVVSTPDLSSAYRIFAVMNARGLDLSPTDILKANIIGEMDPKIRSEYTGKWEGIEEELGRDNFRDLFGHIRMIYMKNKARGALNKEFRDGVLAHINEGSMHFIDEVLTPYADAYKTVIHANYKGTEDADKVNLYLNHLGRLDNSDWIPPAMAFFRRNEGDTSALIQFVRDLERLAYSMFITRKNINQRIDRYSKVIQRIERDEELFKDDSPLQLSDEEKEEFLQTLEGPIYSLTRVRKPLLMRLDGLLAGVGAEYDRPVISIEHVLPQTPDGSSEWIRLFTEEEKEKWTHRLANLVLLDRRKNSRAQNFDFALKKREYFQRDGVSPFPITTKVISESEWTPAVLKRRQRDLIDRLKKEWRLG